MNKIKYVVCKDFGMLHDDGTTEYCFVCLDKIKRPRQGKKFKVLKVKCVTVTQGGN